MAIRQVQLIAPILLTGAAAAVLTAPSNTTYRIGRAGFSNPTANAIPVTAYLVPPAGSPGAGNEIVDAIVVPAGSTYVSPELAGLVIQAGWSLEAFAGTASAIVLYASGVSIQ